MCGIVGIQTSDTSLSSLSREIVDRATAMLSHRGPDGEGIWISPEGHAALGHRRLQIMDIKNGSQPMQDKEGAVVISVNGELYEYASLRKDLESKGYLFQTNSDSELIIHLYQEYGRELVHFLRGEFAFILYDVKKQLTIAGRDRFGIKPLYYHRDSKGTLYMASEAKAILSTGIPAKWNEEALYQVLCFQYLSPTQSLFDGIHSLPPGHLLIYNGKTLQVEKYWDLDYHTVEAEQEDETAIRKKLHDRLVESIRERLRVDDGRICCHLSGGIDSASLAAIASELSGNPIPCFSVSFPHEAYDEARIAEQQAHKIGAAFHRISVGADEIIQHLADAVYFSEGLAINSHLAAKYILNDEIKKAGFKIALTGEGSDEAFAGYIHLKQDYLQTQSMLNSDPVAMGVHISNDPTLDLTSVKNRLGFIPAFFQAKAAIGYKLHELIRTKERSDEIFLRILEENKPAWCQSLAPLQKSSYLWIKFALASSILRTLGDGCEMAHGIEGRVPFLDHKLFEYAQSIPTTLKIKGTVEKYILRETVKTYVTPEIYQKPKHPFMAPPLSLLKNQKGFDFVNDCLRSEAFKTLPFFDHKKVCHYLNGISRLPQAEQISAEPVIMIMLTSFLLAQQYNL